MLAANTKFTHGAWIVVVLIPTLVVAFVAVRQHYDLVARQLSIDPTEVEPPLTAHNQRALLIKGALLFRKGVIVTNVPYHLEQ